MVSGGNRGTLIAPARVHEAVTRGSFTLRLSNATRHQWGGVFSEYDRLTCSSEPLASFCVLRIAFFGVHLHK